MPNCFKVWEKEEMTSCSEVSEVAPADGQEYSTEESTDASSVHLPVVRSSSPRNERGCLPRGYIPQVLYLLNISN